MEELYARRNAERRSQQAHDQKNFLSTTEAIGGAFRVIFLVIPNPDYEAVLDDRCDQITETLNPCCSSNQVISRWNYSKQQ